MFTPFKGLYWLLKEHIRRPTQEEFKKFIYEFIMTYSMGRNDGVLGQMGVQALTELTHYNQSHRVLYLKTEFARMLLDSDIEVPPVNIHMPYDLFELCFEDDFNIIDDKPAPAAIIMLCPQDYTIQVFNDNLKKSTEYARVVLNKLRHERGMKEFESSECHIEGIKDAMRLRYTSVYDDGMCHTAIHVSPNEGCPVDEVIDRTGTLNDPSCIKLDEKEVEVCKRMARIVFGVQCYLNTLNPEVEDYKDRNRPSYVTPANGLLIGKTFHTSPGEHMRKPHPRWLRNNRFKRDESGNMKCVWVRGSIVNRSAEPAAHRKVALLPEEQ